MSELLSVCLFNADADSSAELQDHIRVLNFVRFVDEVRDPDGLMRLLNEQPINVVFFHLDPDAAPVIKLLDQVSTLHPSTATIAISAKTGPEEILAPMRAGCEQFVCRPIDQDDLTNAVTRVVARRFKSRTQGRCVCITGSSGGVGTTSIACNLALEMAHATDTESALMDLHLQFGDAAMNFDCDPSYSLYDLVESAGHVDRVLLASIMNRLPCRVSLLARPQSTDQSESITPELVQEVLELMGNQYENIVVDAPRSIDPCTYAAYRHADRILIVCQLLVPSVHNAKRLHDSLERVGVPAERMEIIVNREDASSARISKDDVSEMFGKPVFASIPNDFEFVARSLDLGRLAASMDRKNPVRAAIRRLACELTSVEGGGEAPGVAATKKGLLSRLFQ